jgi:hypothetical protein
MEGAVPRLACSCLHRCYFPGKVSAQQGLGTLSGDPSGEGFEFNDVLYLQPADANA